jgi:hypothetical protein
MPRPACGQPLSVSSWRYSLVWQRGEVEREGVCVCVRVLSRPPWWSPEVAAAASQPSFLAALDAGGRLRNNAVAAGGRCV